MLEHDTRHTTTCLPLCLTTNRFAAKLKQELGPSRVVYHVEPLLPHSWAVLPTPSMAPKQQVVVAFIAAEHAAAKAAQAATATAAKAVTAGGGDAGV